MTFCLGDGGKISAILGKSQGLGEFEGKNTEKLCRGNQKLDAFCTKKISENI